MISKWRKLASKTITRITPLTSRWLLACEAFEETTWLKITAEGHWRFHPHLSQACPPDGLSIRLAPAELILPDAPAGALIGKIGGSSSGSGHAPPPPPPSTTTTFNTGAPSQPPPAPTELDPGLGNAFVIGSHVVFPLPGKPEGPLYISVNTTRREVEFVRLNLIISGGVPD